MPKVIEAVYENGVFKPLQKVDLKEGEKVKVELKESVVESVAGILKVSDEKVKKALEMIEYGEDIY
ncbi:antitoxin family protein [Archaeoglobus fulgidus]|jgi:predicted DNA-binding antitoxin AbrB/MazE fold protein|uniref:Putative antitoxin VapB7 n=2 Tax=Archaeoglobus fulgidus TaxID=2234 RepID=VAPB7_ARCFU|nr:antitoxin family protein [Archaeoglobus fulgidus]O29926.2 RecName: Full=Putative antitoxin VapB7 [Archaeoglobus fulgidus DSM 4304]